ncbi:hypothetical protein ACSQ67_011112 [Phaseolus vulgaris]
MAAANYQCSQVIGNYKLNTTYKSRFDLQDNGKLVHLRCKV